MLNKYFDKIYCINLDTRPDKWEQCQEEFKKNNLIVERVPGILGNPDNIETKIVPGHVGCVLSHVEVVKDALKNGYEKILVLEDDVVFKDKLNELFEKYYKQVPDDWSMLYFGGNHNGIPYEMLSENVGKVKKMYTTHCYALKKEMFKPVIKMFPKVQYEVDVYYSMLQNSFPCYVMTPHLAWQREGYSDILKKNVNYSFLKN